MESQGDDELWTKCGKFYVEDGVEELVRSGGIHTKKLPEICAQGGTSPGALPRTNIDTPGGKPELHDCATARPVRGGADDLHCGLWPG